MAQHPPFKQFEITSLQLPNGSWQVNFGIPGRSTTIAGATRETHSTMAYRDRNAALAEAHMLIEHHQ